MSVSRCGNAACCDWATGTDLRADCLQLTAESSVARLVARSGVLTLCSDCETSRTRVSPARNMTAASVDKMAAHLRRAGVGMLSKHL